MLLLLATALAQSPVAVPTVDGPWAPSALQVIGAPDPLGAEACEACHQDQVDSWSGSAHAHASLDNPWYLASFEALRSEVSPRASRHCGGCHDPALLATGALDGEVGPGHALGTAGVTCLTCHAQATATPAGNASIVVDLSDLPDPRTDVASHAARMAIDEGACMGCHRGVLLPQMGAPRIHGGFDDWGAWQGSAWAGTDAARLEPQPRRATCIDCHDHRMAGGRTALAGDHLLDDAVSLWLPQVWIDGALQPLDVPLAPPAGSEVVIEAVVRNTGVGHRFPGGLADTQDVWLQVAVTSASDTVVLQGPHLRGLPLDEEGQPVRDHEPHRIAMGAFDHTVPPGEAQVLRVGFVAPGGALQLEAALQHRPHRPELAAAACAVTSPLTLDGCAPLPVTTVARPRPMGEQGWYALALGYSRGTTDDLPLAHEALDHAVAHGLAADTAAVLRGRILGRQGRADEALQVLDGLPDHPAVWATRGQALLTAWRFEPAADALARAAELAPLHVPTWRGLARALGSVGDDEAAYEAARAGLALAPRDAELLRSQALAARALGLPGADTAEAAWLAHRPPDGLDRLRIQCERTDSECRERGAIPLVWADNMVPTNPWSTP